MDDLTAVQAKELSKSVHGTMVKMEWVLIQDLINNQSKAGRSLCIYKWKLMDETRIKIEGDPFNFVVTWSELLRYTTISWNEEDLL